MRCVAVLIEADEETEEREHSVAFRLVGRGFDAIDWA
jgi:hypothetical protein